MKKKNCVNNYILFLFRERLNVGTVPTYKMHLIGTVPTYKMHLIGTVPMFKMHLVGTVPMFKKHLIGTMEEKNHL